MNHRNLQDSSFSQEEDDSPIACTFFDQSNERRLIEKQISESVSQSKKRLKELRRVKHAENVHTDENQCTDHGKKFHKPMVNFEKTTDSITDEFNMSTHFNAIDHLDIQPTVTSRDMTKSRRLDLVADINESDEGYDGSEEQERREKQKSNTPKCQTSQKLTKYTYSNTKPKKLNRSSTVRIQLLNNTKIEKVICGKADQFMQECLFTSPSTNRYHGVMRVQPDLLKSLARKQKVRSGI